MSALEQQMALQIRAARLPVPEREFRFCQARRWRADFAWPNAQILLEIEGGTWIRGAHSRGKHFESDCEKYAEAAILGYRVLRVTTDMVKDGRALELLRRILAS